jgi:hypothetical protein
MAPKNENTTTTQETNSNEGTGLGSKIANAKDSVVSKVGDIKDSLTGNEDTRSPEEIKFDEAKQAFQNQTADLEDTKNLVVGEARVIKDTVYDTAESVRETLANKIGNAQDKAEVAGSKDERPGFTTKIASVKDSVVDKVSDVKESWTDPKDTRDPTEVKFDEAKEAFKNQTADLEDTKNLIVGEASILKKHLTSTGATAEDKAIDTKEAAADDVAEALGTARNIIENEE